MKKKSFFNIFIIFILVTSLFSQNLPLDNTSKNKTAANKSYDDKNQYIKVSLIDVVLETVSQSNNVKAAREKLIQAKIKLDDSSSGYLPSLDATYKNARIRTSPGNDGASNKFYNDESYKLAVTQNLYAGGSTYNEIKSLEKKYDVAKNEYKIAISKEIENAIKAYFDVLFNFKSLTVNIENMDRLNEVLEIVNIKYESGAASIGDLSSIKANVSNAESKLIKIQSKFNEALEYYKYIVGDDFTKTFPYEDTFDTSVDDFDTIIEKAIANNITIKNFKLNIEAQKFKLISAKSSFRPKIDLELSNEKITDQEDYVEDENNYKAQIVLSYNFYNKGKDKKKMFSLNSMVRELEYKRQEEIRKLKWTLSKLQRSITSVSNVSVSTKAEVAASQEMVKAYWEGFKLGEQDLQELLQGQRQLNSAQLALIENKKTIIQDYFKLLSSVGELLDYFRLDIAQDNFIDFGKSEYKNLLKTQIDKKDIVDNTVKNNDIIDISMEPSSIQEDNTNNTDTNATVVTIDNNVTKNEDNTTKTIENKKLEDPYNLDNLLAFKGKFQQASDDKWTIRVYYFDKLYQALDFSKNEEISNNIFVFDTLYQNEVKTNIAYKIFDTQEQAKDALKDIKSISVKKEVINIKAIKEMYQQFKNKKLQPEVKKLKPFQTNPIFKKEFLEADDNLYTINIASFSSIKDAQELIDEEKIYRNSFVFLYGDQKEWVKVVYGLFQTYEEASLELEKRKALKQKYDPIIETINSKKELYRKYNKEEENKTLLSKKEIDKKIKQKAAIRYKNKNIAKIAKAFQEDFMKAPKEYYTLNLATLYNEKQIETYYKRNSPYIDVFVFPFGEDFTRYKAVGGIYATYKEAKNAFKQIPSHLRQNQPRIEKIEIKQKLYRKYNLPKEN